MTVRKKSHGPPLFFFGWQKNHHKSWFPVQDCGVIFFGIIWSGSFLEFLGVTQWFLVKDCVAFVSFFSRRHKSHIIFHGGSFTHARPGLPAPQPSRRHNIQSLLGPSFHDPGTHHVLESHTERAAPLSRRDDERWHANWLSLRPCTAPPSCNLQPLLRLSLLSLRPSLLQFVSIVSPLLNHGNPIFEPVCMFWLFLFCFCISDRKKLQLQVSLCNLVVITTAIPLLLFP